MKLDLRASSCASRAPFCTSAQSGLWNKSCSQAVRTRVEESRWEIVGCPHPKAPAQLPGTVHPQGHLAKTSEPILRHPSAKYLYPVACASDQQIPSALHSRRSAPVVCLAAESERK